MRLRGPVWPGPGAAAGSRATSWDSRTEDLRAGGEGPALTSAEALRAPGTALLLQETPEKGQGSGAPEGESQNAHFLLPALGQQQKRRGC